MQMKTLKLTPTVRKADRDANIIRMEVGNSGFEPASSKYLPSHHTQI